MRQVIPCQPDEELRAQIKAYADALLTEGHHLGKHGLGEAEFYRSGIFRGAIERVRGSFSATTRNKTEFVRLVLNHMQDCGYVREWEHMGTSNRHDYKIELSTGRIAVVETKGCLDGNNTTIYERPAYAEEFVIWSLCMNLGSDLGKNVWSGIHTRLSADLVSRQQGVDGVIVWDMLCSNDRPCPKVELEDERRTTLGQFRVPPPCIYLLPSTNLDPAQNPSPRAQPLEQSHLLTAFHQCFGGRDEELNHVDFDVAYGKGAILRKTTIHRGGDLVADSKMMPVRRSSRR